jgi:hypothetical protein
MVAVTGSRTPVRLPVLAQPLRNKIQLNTTNVMAEDLESAVMMGGAPVARAALLERTAGAQPFEVVDELPARALARGVNNAQTAD